MAEGKQVSNGEQAEKLLKAIRAKEREAQDAKRIWQDRKDDLAQARKDYEAKVDELMELINPPDEPLLDQDTTEE